MAVEYGTIGILPLGEYNPEKQYDLLNAVSYDGSSYVVHTKPPVGTLPTSTAYWQVSAQGTGKATAESVGTVKPDGVTTEVSADGVMSAKTATQSTVGAVKGSAGINVSEDGGIDLNTDFKQATELANLIAGEAIAKVLGKVSKSIADVMNLNQNALLKNMLTNIDVNDPNKLPTSAYIHTLVERIGMSTELVNGQNLTAAVNQLNSDFGNKEEVTIAQASDFNGNVKLRLSKVGHEVDGWMRIVNNVPIPAVKIFTQSVPENYKPYIDSAFVILRNSTVDQTFCAYYDNGTFRTTEQPINNTGIWYGQFHWSCK